MQDDRLIFEKSQKDHRGCVLPKYHSEIHLDIPFPRQSKLLLPEIAEVDMVRHYVNLSKKAHGVDNGFYPLGSCTMKYNPRVNEDVASLINFAKIHPLQDIKTTQGCLEAMDLLEHLLQEITGMDAITLAPAAGAHGEFTGLLLVRSYHEYRQDTKRKYVIVPDSAHGTNPASANMAGYEIINIPSNPNGLVNLEALRAAVNEETAALMLTNPNTLGLFETDIKEIADIVHEKGGLLYYDGANLNAIMGICRPADMGFDIVHLNLHKTFSTPHGGGGPGSGPVGCIKKLEPFLPNYKIEQKDGQYDLSKHEHSMGSVKAFYGNFLVYLKALTYILVNGRDGLKDVSLNAILNANYLMDALKHYYDLDHDTTCMHEFVLSAATLKKEKGVSAMDIAKTLLDYGIHPPTVYFPLVVSEALMIEPTETESKETLDHAISVFKEIFEIAMNQTEDLHQRPLTTPITRIDEVSAARNPILKYKGE